jgi:hypothetical protein
MNFRAIWHWLTTSRYTRQLERENEELRAQLKELRTENHALVFALGRRPAEFLQNPETDETAAVQGAAMQLHGPTSPRRGRPGKFVGFSQAKKRLESQESPQRRTS